MNIFTSKRIDLQSINYASNRFPACFSSLFNLTIMKLFTNHNKKGFFLRDFRLVNFKFLMAVFLIGAFTNLSKAQSVSYSMNCGSQINATGNPSRIGSNTSNFGYTDITTDPPGTNPPYAGENNPSSGTQLQVYSNQGNAQAGVFRPFSQNVGTSGGAGTLRALQPGDRVLFQIATPSAANSTGLYYPDKAGAAIGISFNNNTNFTTGTTTANLTTNQVCKFEMTSTTQRWSMYSGASLATVSTNAATTPGTTQRYLQIDVTSSNTFDATIYSAYPGTYVKYYNLSFGTSGPITSFAVYTIGVATGNNPDLYVYSVVLSGADISSTTTLPDTKGITFAGTADVTISGNITQGSNASTGTAFATPVTVATGATNVLTLTSTGSTYTGATTLTSGILRLGATNAIPSTTTAVVFNGGTLSTGATTGFSDAMTNATIGLTNNSTLALGTGNHTITFANSSGVSWTAGKTLTITGWTGSTGASGTAGKIIVSSATGLTAGQLGQISFSGFSGVPTIILNGSSQYELVPGNIIPIPTTGAANTPTGTAATTSATLNGTVNPNNLVGVTTKFDWGLTTSYAGGSNLAATTGGSPTGSSAVAATYNIASGLTPNTLYHFRIKANYSSTDYLGSDATFTTLSNAPTVGTGSSPSNNGFTANWTAPSGQGSEVYTFTVEASTSTSFSSIAATGSLISSGTTSYTFTTLNISTTYYFRVKAVNAGGVSAWSATSAAISTLENYSWYNSSYKAGPFYIKNNYTGGFGSGTYATGPWFQYLYDDATNTTKNELDSASASSSSDATGYTNIANCARIQATTDAGIPYANNINYMWVLEDTVINSVTYKRIKNVATGRYFHTGRYGNYYSQDNNNNSLDLLAWNTTNVNGATGVNGSTAANKELSYYLYYVPSAPGTITASFTSLIENARWAIGGYSSTTNTSASNRFLHGELSNTHTTAPRPAQVFFTDNTNSWGTKSWDFNVATIAPTVTSQAATSITATTATLNGTAIFSGGSSVTISTRGFKISSTAGFDPSTSGTNVTATGTGLGAFTGSAGSLINGTTYYYYAYVTNSASTTSYSAVQSFVAVNPITPDVTLDNSTIAQPAAGNITQGSTDNILSNFRVIATSANATMTGLSFNGTGNFAAGDILNYKLYTTTTNTFSSPTLLSTVTATSFTGTSAVSFSFSQVCTNGVDRFFWITADVGTGSAAIGKTISVPVGGTGTNLLPVFTLANITNNIAAGNTKTISAGTPVITLDHTNMAQTSAGSIVPGSTNAILSNFRTNVTIADATMNSISFTIGGTFVAGDLTNIKLFTSTSTTFPGGSALSTVAATSFVGGTSTVTFSSLNQPCVAGARYFWITADVASGATIGKTVIVPASPTVTFALGTPTNNITVGGTKTIQAYTNYYNYSTSTDPTAFASWTTDATGATLVGSPTNFTSGDKFTIRATTSMQNNSAWTVNGGVNTELIINGSFTQSNTLSLGGAFTNNGSFNNGNNTLTLTTNGSIGGSVATTFNNLTINTTNSTDIVTLNKSGITFQNGAVITLQKGIFKVGAANTINLGTSGGITINANNGTTNTGNFANASDGTGLNTDADGGTLTTNMQSGNQLLVNGAAVFYNIFTNSSDANQRLSLANAGTKINGTLKVVGSNSNQYAVQTNSPIWGANSTLSMDRNGQGYTPGLEWNATSGYVIGTTPGYPNNVTIMNVGTSNGNNAGVNITTAISINGKLSIGDGTTAAVVAIANASFSCGGVTIDKGSTLYGITSFTNKGNWLRQGSPIGVYTPTAGTTITFAGSGTSGSPQTIGLSTGTETSIINIAITSGYVKLNSPVTLPSAGVLTLTSGILETDATNILNISNTATGGLAGGSATSYINGPVTRGIVTGLSGASQYVFHVGKGSSGGYLPLTINPTTTANTSATVEAFNTNSGGTADGTTLSNISTTEYWKLTTATNLTAGILGLGRVSSLGTLNKIGKSASQGGSYSSLAGTVSTINSQPAVITSNNVGGAGTYYLALAKYAFPITVTQTANGTIAPGTTEVAGGGTQAFTITPNSCYGIASVTVDGSSVALTSPYTFTNVTAAHTITATYSALPAHSISLSSGAGTNNQSVCALGAISNITFAVGGGANGAGATNLPAGVTGSYNSGVFTISGTPTTAGTYNYTVTTTGNSCTAATASGQIIVAPSFSYANLQSPPSGSQCQTGTFDIYGQVYAAGVTSGTVQGSGVEAQFGYNTSNNNPNLWPAGNWSNAIFNSQTVNNNNNEFKGTFSGLAPGTYYYTFRYRLTSGCQWQYGGYNIGGGGFWDGTANVNGQLTITPTHTITLSSGNASPTLCASTPLTNIVFAVGGATGASITSGSFPTGVTGSYSGGNYTITGTPTQAGTFPYTITTSGGSCTPQTQSGTITVKPVFTYANLQFPASGIICQSGTFTAYGRVYAAGITEAGGAPANTTAELGYGPQGTNPNTWTNWTTATWNAQFGNDDEFVATLSSLTPGAYDYAFRFSLNGCTYQYGGTGGLWSSGTSGTLTVNATATAPTFIAGATSSRCQEAGPVTYGASIPSSTGITLTYTLDQPSLDAGNTIVAGTGAVTFTSGWTGQSIITATAHSTAGCGSDASSTHTVSTAAPVTPAVSIAITSGSNPTCAGSNITFTATATNTGGGTVLYNFKVNGASVQNLSSNTYSTSTLTQGKTVSCTISITDGNCINFTTANTLTDITISVNTGYTWTGSGNVNNFSDPNNWLCLQAPASGQSITVQPGKTTTIPADFEIANLNLGTGSIINLNGHTLTITGDLTGDGTFKGSSTSGLIYNGSAGATINFDPSANLLHTLIIGNDATLGNTLNIVSSGGEAGKVIVREGMTLNSDGNLVLTSNIEGTSRVGIDDESIAGISGLISGDVTVERYTAQHTNRGWRMLAIPTQSTQTIFESWQESGVNNNGYGTLITSPTGAAGFDAQTPGYSLLQYSPGPSPAWVGEGAATTTTPIVNADKAWMIYIRGNRTVGTSTSTTGAGAAQLRTKGPLYQGDQQVNLVDGFNLVGNPYTSEINWETIEKTTGVSQTLGLWDPQLLGTYNLGAFVYFNGGIRNGDPGGSYPGDETPKIQSGMAFLVQALGSGQSLTIKESDKTDGGNAGGTGFRPTGATSYFVTGLYPMVSGNPVYADGVTAAFNSSFSNNIDGNDAVKTSNFGESIGMVRDNKLLAIERRDAVADPIYYQMSGLKTMKYRLEFTPTSISGVEAILEDAYLSTSTPIDLTVASHVDFDAVSTNPATFTNRFKIVFKALNTTPVTITNVNAQQKNTAMQIDWKVQVETGVKEYVVEHSTDGTNFTKVGTVPASTNNGGAAVYSLLDVAPSAGVNYYRIKTIDLSGAVRYTYIIKVIFGKATPSITLNSTIINNGRISLQMNNEEKGKYAVRLTNAVGQQLMNESIQYNGGSSTQTFTVRSLVSKGVYYVEIVKPSGIKQVEKVVVN